MEKCEDKTMTVKEELGILIEKLIKGYEATSSGFPLNPKRKDINPIIYIGEPNGSGWSKWKPIKQTPNDEFLTLLNILNIEANQDIIEYFTSYYFLTFSIKYKSYVIRLNDIAPEVNFKRLKMEFENFRDDRDGKIKYIPIGLEVRVGYSVVVEVKTGLVKFFDSENGKTRKIATSLQEFLKNSEPKIIPL